MKKYFNVSILSIVLKFVLFSSFISMTSCRKDDSGSTNNPSGNKGCKLVFWKATEVAQPFKFEYNSVGKISRSRVFSNGNGAPPNVTIYEYTPQNQLLRTFDSVNVAANNEFTSTIYYSDYNNSGYPLKAVNKLVKSGRRFAELEFEYNSKNNVTRAIIQIFDGNDKPYRKDTAHFYYDNNENFIKGTANTVLNGVRKEYIGIEAEGYDTKPCFYGSLGIEPQVQRIAASNDAYMAAGYYAYYLYSPSANNPGKVYLHNQGTDNKGDYLTYTYIYDPVTDYPSSISFTNTQLGVTRGPSNAEARYECK